MKRKCWGLVIAACCVWGSGAKSQSADVATARELLASGDELGFRAYVRKLYRENSSPEDALAVHELLMKNASQVGFDLLYAWDRRLSLDAAGKMSKSVATALAQSDASMERKDFTAAFAGYQRVARALQKSRKAGFGPRLIPGVSLEYFVFEAMGRALYGAGRFPEAYEAFNWIPVSFPKFRQVLFEKMWAAFRMGRIDLALGLIASQKSAYFSGYLQPEAYLVQLYIYKRLCRDADLKRVVQDMKNFRKDLKSGTVTLGQWARSDVEGSVLWRLSHLPKGEDDGRKAGREAERRRILKALTVGFNQEHDQWLSNLEVALAFADLSVTAGGDAALKPVDRLPSRENFFKMNLEIWPADSAEEWIDEIGTHRFVGSSQCAVK